METVYRSSPLVNETADDHGQEEDDHQCPKTDGNQLLHLQRTVSLITEEEAAGAAVRRCAAADQTHKYVSAFQR